VDWLSKFIVHVAVLAVWGAQEHLASEMEHPLVLVTSGSFSEKIDKYPPSVHWKAKRIYKMDNKENTPEKSRSKS